MTDSQRLEELHQDVKTILRDRLPALEVRLVKMETKHSTWGAIAGFFGGVLAAFLGGHLNGGSK